MPALESITASPPNLSVPLSSLAEPELSQAEMYVRCNFEPPITPPSSIEVVIPGAAERKLTTAELDAGQLTSVSMVLECAGNGRTLMRPIPEGTPWTLGGASPVVAQGVRLRDVVGDLNEDIVDVVFTGADRGYVEPHGSINYQFAIPRELATSDLPLLVTRIGGEPLTLLHGAPARLIIPGHYAMMSVKWLTRIEAITSEFHGHFVEKYRYFGDEVEKGGSRVGVMAVRSIITNPSDGETVDNPVAVEGAAWSAKGVRTVRLSTDGGGSWVDAELGPLLSPFSSRSWKSQVELHSGTHELMVRAWDSDGNTQPLSPRWNVNGYANNTVHRLSVRVS